MALVFNLLLKSASITKLVNKVIVVSSFEYFDEAYDMSCVLNFGKSLYLVDGELLKFGTGFEFFDLDDFDGNCLVSFFVDCSVNLSKLSLANDVVQNVVLDLFSHYKFVC